MAGVPVSLLAAPTELLKCRLQAQGGARPPPGAAYTAADVRAGRALFNGPLQVMRSVLAHEGGVLGLYRGLGATLLREAPGNAGGGGGRGGWGPAQGPRAVVSWSCKAAGAPAGGWTRPPSPCPGHRWCLPCCTMTPLCCAPRVSTAHPVRTTPAAYFGFYDACKAALAAAQGIPQEQLGAGSLLVAGGVGGASFWAFTYPIDVIKSRMQTQNPFAADRFRGIWDCGQRLYREGGRRALYRGYTPCLMRSVPANAVAFLTFESVRSRLSGQ